MLGDEQEMESGEKNGVVYGLRHFDFFFFPRLRVSEKGIEVIKKQKFIEWNRVTRIRRCDNALWTLTRGPLGTYVYYDDDRTFWISSRIVGKDASFRELFRAYFSHSTDHYRKVLQEIEKHIDVSTAEAECRGE